MDAVNNHREPVALRSPRRHTLLFLLLFYFPDDICYFHDDKFTEQITQKHNKKKDSDRRTGFKRNELLKVKVTFLFSPHSIFPVAAPKTPTTTTRPTPRPRPAPAQPL